MSIYLSEKDFTRINYFINYKQLRIDCDENMSIKPRPTNLLYILFTGIEFMHVPRRFRGIEITEKESATNESPYTFFSLRCLKTNTLYSIKAGRIDIIENAEQVIPNSFFSTTQYWWEKQKNFKHVLSYPELSVFVLNLREQSNRSSKPMS